LSSAEPDARIAELQARLQQSEAHNAALQAELERFAYTVSHDLRAPLRHITSYAPLVREMLAEGEDPAQCLDTLEQSARNMARMLDAVLELSRLSRVAVQPVLLPLAALVAEAQRALAPALEGRVVEWQLPDSWPEVHGDAVLLRQLWQHLLSNALKFTRTRPSARIALGWQKLHGAVELWVQDNGVGFNPAASGTMFDLFQRLHTVSEFEGVGVGLALARQIVLRHGGCIQAEGVVDGGCIVRFTLPL
jgi:two-component system OmpR family sensor kinase